MKFISLKVVIIILFLYLLYPYSTIFSAQPIVKIPDPISQNLREAYVENENLFLETLWTYLKNAIILEAQYNIITSKRPYQSSIILPTLDEIENPKFETLQKYYDIMKRKAEEIEKVDYNYMPNENLIDENERLRDSLFTLNLINYDYNILKKRFERLQSEYREFQKRCSEKILQCEKEKRQNPEFRNTPLFPVTSGNEKFKVSIGSHFFTKNGIDTECDVSLGTSVMINAGKILGYLKNFDFWAEYFEPKLKTHFPLEKTYEWSVRMLSLGVGANIYDIVTFTDFSIGLRFGGGFFWGDGRIQNTEIPKNSWNGYTLFGEINTMDGHIGVPIELYFRYSLFSPKEYFYLNSKNKILTAPNSVFDNIGIGVRISF